MTKPKAFLLGLQPRFVPLVKNGSKAHTIRGERKDGKRPQPGDMITIYTGLRTKACEFVLRAPCLRTEDIEIFWSTSDSIPTGNLIQIGDSVLSQAEADLLAWNDGFRVHPVALESINATSKHSGAFELMMQFWRGRLPFKGWITHWDYSKAEFERVPVGGRV